MFGAVSDNVATDISNVLVAIIVSGGSVGAAVLAVKRSNFRNRPDTKYHDQDISNLSANEMRELMRYMKSDMRHLKAELEETKAENRYLLTQVK